MPGFDLRGCPPPGESSGDSTVAAARDPNAKHVDGEIASPGDALNFTIEFENEGEGIAFGVYVTDRLDADLDESTLMLPPGSRLAS